MPEFDPDAPTPPPSWGSYDDAEALRRWSFRRRTPEQRLRWLQSALELAYQNGALKPRVPPGTAVGDSTRELP